MPIKVAKSLIRLIIVLMFMECFVAAFATPASLASNSKSITKKSFTALLCSALLAEIEEEKSEEEADKALTVELADFTKNISFLSRIHTPHQQFMVYEHLDDHQPSLFKLNCVFII